MGLTHYSQNSEKVNESDVHGVAEEHEGRRGRIPAATAAAAAASEPAASLVVVDAEQGERELDLVPSPYSPDQVRVAESTQDGADADPVEALVAAEGDDDGADGGGGRGGHVAEAEVFPEGVVAGEGGPEAADAGGDAEGRPVEAFEDLDEDVNVVVDEELGPFLFVF
ncbi:unnamed protein product [Prunus armeniaca]|uniref:Uncharacterized protein n=1 Tax=Prunus armeniaca TaxID=36596 RepID=A0A6J5UDY3_PRUAR|nr:unnamed protein product [Prunus armeniaca]